LKKDDKGVTAKADTLLVEIFDNQNKRIRHFKTGVEKGMNRFAWALEMDGIRTPDQAKPAPDAPTPGGMPVMAGSYKVRLTYGDYKDSTTVNVKADPRMNVNPQDVNIFYNAYNDFAKNVSAVTSAMDNLREAKGRTNSIMAMVNDQLQDEKKKKDMQELSKKLTGVIDTMMLSVMPDESIKGIFDDPDMLLSRIGSVATYFTPTFGTPNPPFHAPTEGHKAVMQNVKKEINDFINKVNNFFASDWANFEQQVDALKLDITKPITKVSME
jgi:hypothetical protein